MLCDFSRFHGDTHDKSAGAMRGMNSPEKGSMN